MIKACPHWPCRSNRTLAELGLLENGHAAAQSSLHLTPGRLRVTSEDNFWTIMLRVLPAPSSPAQMMWHLSLLSWPQLPACSPDTCLCITDVLSSSAAESGARRENAFCWLSACLRVSEIKTRRELSSRVCDSLLWLQVASPESSYNDDEEQQRAKGEDLLKHIGKPSLRQLNASDESWA